MESDSSEATLGVMRVIRSDDKYSSAESFPEIRRSTTFGRWSLTVKIGQMSDAARAISILATHGRRLFLDAIFGGLNLPNPTGLPPFTLRDQEIDRLLTIGEIEEDWVDPQRIYTEIIATRPIRIPRTVAEAGPGHFWVPDDLAHELITSNEDAAETALGYIVARLMTNPALRHIGELDSRRLRFFVDHPGRERALLSVMGGSAHATVTRGSWDETHAALNDLPIDLPATVSRDNRTAIGRIGQFYSMAYSESNQFMRFIWSYNGLEVIGNAVGTHGRSAILSRVARDTGLGRPTIEDLLWPKDVRDTDPNRSIRFRFAVAATLLSNGSEAADVDAFMKVNKARNSIHGRLLSSLNLPTQQAFNLLDKYAGRAVEFLTAPAEPE